MKAAKHFGLAFQVADDIGDVEQDKINDRDVNVCHLFGLEEARKMFHVELEQYKSCLETLGLDQHESLVKAVDVFTLYP